MTDVFSKRERSSIMAKVRCADTKPELLVRSIVHRLGYRFRLHRRDLPGAPDVVLPRHSKAILIHGCFWHGHSGCRKANRPTTNTDFWNNKLDKNIKRDATNLVALRNLGWTTLIIWECQTRSAGALEHQLREFLNV